MNIFVEVSEDNFRQLILTNLISQVHILNAKNVILLYCWWSMSLCYFFRNCKVDSSIQKNLC